MPFPSLDRKPLREETRNLSAATCPAHPVQEIQAQVRCQMVVICLQAGYRIVSVHSSP
jgi:hypothetical protein